MQKLKIALIILFALLLGGGFLRIYRLAAAPYWMDEGYTINAVSALADHGAPVLDSGKTYSCTLYCAPTAWITSVFGKSAFSYRILAALVGTLFILVAFAAGTTFANRNVGIIAAFFAAFSYYQIAWSRQARWYSLFEIFFWLALICFWKTLYERRRRVLWAAGAILFTLLAIATQPLGYALLGIGVAWTLIDQLQKQRLDLKKILLAAAGCAALAAIAEFFFAPGFLKAVWQAASFHYELPYYLSFYLRNYWLPIIFAIGYALQRRRKETWFLLLVLAACLVPFAFLTDIVHYRYLFHLTPVFFILGAAGIWEAAALLRERWQKVCFGAVVVLLFFASGEGVLKPTSMYFLESDNPATIRNRPYYAYTPQPNWNAAYGFIAQDKSANDIIISSQPQFNKIFLNEAGYWIKYDYLGFDHKEADITDDREYYVGAKVIDDLPELQSIMAANHGYIVFDYMILTRVPRETLEYIAAHAKQVFYEKTNEYSQVWVYRF